jgi:hypothetical protein
MGRPLGPSGGREFGGGGTGLPEGLRGGRDCGRSGADGAPVSGAWAAGAWAGGEGATGAVAAGAWAAGAEAAGAAGAWAAGAWAAGAWGGAAGGAVGRLLMRRDGRGATSWPPGVGPLAGASVEGAATVRAGAFFRGAVLGETAPEELTTAFLAGAAVLTGAPVSAAGADLVVLAAFLAAAGSSGWTGRRSPSASALRRTRSACASSIDDEWLFTPMPRDRASSSPSLLVRPSSLASS